MTDNDSEYVGEIPGGFHLFRKPNEAGGFTYYSDEIGGGVIVWDTCLVSSCTLIAAIAAENMRISEEYYKEHENDDHQQ